MSVLSLSGVIGQELREIFPDTILEETVTIEGGEPETTLFLDETALLYKVDNTHLMHGCWV